MEKIIKDAMTENILKEAGVLYDTSYESIKYVGGFENFVYEYEKNGKFVILRFVHSVHREYDQVLAELEFIDYLDNNGASVSTVIHSHDDNLVERIEAANGHYFTVCAFTKAPGARITREDLTDDFWTVFGKEVGKLHSLTKNYSPKHKRVSWDQEDIVIKPHDYLPEKDGLVLEKCNKIIKRIQGLQKNNENYGLIHTDLHFGNMFISSGKLTFFDWDDSSYKHFLSDIAIILYYPFAFSDVDQTTKNREIRRILPLFLKGYRTENTIKDDDLLLLNDFFMLRSVVLYIVIHASGEDAINSPWGKNFIAKYRNQILEETPFVDLDFVLEGQ